MLAARHRSQPSRPLIAARLRRTHTTLMSALNTYGMRRLLPLDHAQPHRLYALLHLIAFHGLRRGEAVGLSWTEVDLEQSTLTVSRQILQLGAQ